jgi:hypothetical protein
VTAFIAICAVMSLAAVLIAAWPMWRAPRGAATTRPIAMVISLAMVLPLVAGGLYWKFGHRTWEKDLAESNAQLHVHRELGVKVAELERRVRESPNDAAVLMELAETLISQDERAIVGRAGQLLEQALQVAPTHPKALWYGAIHALAQQQLPLARDRLSTMLAQNPPADIRSIIERQIQDIEQQISQSSAPAVPAAGRVVNVQVALAPTLNAQVAPDTPLFIMARDPSGAGPPLAAVRRRAGDLPLSISLSDKDAMMQGRGIGQASRVQIVARIAKGGTPQAQPGDLYGEALVELTGNGAHNVSVAIQHTVAQ